MFRLKLKNKGKKLVTITFIRMDPVVLQKIISLSGGNPGAITVFAEIYKTQPLELVKKLLGVLENSTLRGPDIWVLWKNTSNKDISLFITNVLALENK